MEYKGVEYSIVQITDGGGWQWEVRFADRNKKGVTPVSRAVAIKQAKSEIDHIMRDTE
jgi:hypothetical protein